VKADFWLSVLAEALASLPVFLTGLWVSHRKLRRHVDTVTRTQTGRVRQMTDDQTERLTGHLDQVTAQQTAQLEAGRSTGCDTA